MMVLQATGSASTIAIGNIYLFLTLSFFSMFVGAGVVNDIYPVVQNVVDFHAWSFGEF
jgi:hypothetical protein